MLVIPEPAVAWTDVRLLAALSMLRTIARTLGPHSLRIRSHRLQVQPQACQVVKPAFTFRMC